MIVKEEFLKINTIGELRRNNYKFYTVKEELRKNLIYALRHKEPIFPGIIGYEETVILELINAILSQHDFILLGLRGQAKTRILRDLVNLLDSHIPIIKNSEINDHPFIPKSKAAKDRRKCLDLGFANMCKRKRNCLQPQRFRSKFTGIAKQDPAPEEKLPTDQVQEGCPG